MSNSRIDLLDESVELEAHTLDPMLSAGYDVGSSLEELEIR